MKKASIALIYAVAAYILYEFGETILLWMQQTEQLTLITVAAIVFALFPIIPYPIVGGIIGAAFGPVTGTVITWIGSAAASILMFAFIRYGYSDWGEKLLHGNRKLDKVTRLFEKNAFLAVLFCRLIPMIPSFAVNIYSALSRMPFSAYAISSSLGKIPSMVLFAIVGDRLLNDPSHIGWAIAIYGGFLLITFSLNRWWQRGKVNPLDLTRNR